MKLRRGPIDRRAKHSSDCVERLKNQPTGINFVSIVVSFYDLIESLNAAAATRLVFLTCADVEKKNPHPAARPGKDAEVVFKGLVIY